MLAGAEEFAGRGIGRPFDGREFAALVAAVAEGLVLGTPAGAPPVILAGLDGDRDRRLLDDIGFGHCLSFLFAIAIALINHLRPPSWPRPRRSPSPNRARAGYRPGAR